MRNGSLPRATCVSLPPKLDEGNDGSGRSQSKDANDTAEISIAFMTVAWYGHLEFRSGALWKVILASWGSLFSSTASRCRRTVSAPMNSRPRNSRRFKRLLRSRFFRCFRFSISGAASNELTAWALPSSWRQPSLFSTNGRLNRSSPRLRNRRVECPCNVP